MISKISPSIEWEFFKDLIRTSARTKRDPSKTERRPFMDRMWPLKGLNKKLFKD